MSKKHDLVVQRLEAAVASIKNAGGPDDLPFLAGPELTLVERLERRIAQVRGRLEAPRARRRRNRDALEDQLRREHLGEDLADRAASRIVCLDLREEEPVPFYLDAWEHEARGWSVR